MLHIILFIICIIEILVMCKLVKTNNDLNRNLSDERKENVELKKKNDYIFNDAKAALTENEESRMSVIRRNQVLENYVDGTTFKTYKNLVENKKIE